MYLNETMKLIGEQNAEIVLSGNVRKSIIDVLDSYQMNKNGILLQMAVDLFILGTIYGKRKERERKCLKKSS